MESRPHSRLWPLAAVLALAACAPLAPWDDPTAFPSARRPTAESLLSRARTHMDPASTRGQIDVLTTVAACNGPTGPFTTTVHAASGGRVVFEQSAPGEDVFRGITNGDLAWMTDAEGTTHEPAPAPLRAMFRGHANHYLALHVDTAYRNHKLVGETLLGGAPCWKVRMIDELGEPAWAFFGRDNGRLEGLTITNSMGRGAPTLTIFYEDWRDAGPLHLFHAFTLVHGEEVWTYRYTDIRLNEQDPTIFAIPAALRAGAEAPPG